MDVQAGLSQRHQAVGAALCRVADQRYGRIPRFNVTPGRYLLQAYNTREVTNNRYGDPPKRLNRSLYRRLRAGRERRPRGSGGLGLWTPRPSSRRHRRSCHERRQSRPIQWHHRRLRRRLAAEEWLTLSILFSVPTAIYTWQTMSCQPVPFAAITASVEHLRTISQPTSPGPDVSKVRSRRHPLRPSVLWACHRTL